MTTTEEKRGRDEPRLPLVLHSVEIVVFAFVRRFNLDLGFFFLRIVIFVLSVDPRAAFAELVLLLVGRFSQLLALLFGRRCGLALLARAAAAVAAAVAASDVRSRFRLRFRFRFLGLGVSHQRRVRSCGLVLAGLLVLFAGLEPAFRLRFRLRLLSFERGEQRDAAVLEERHLCLVLVLGRSRHGPRVEARR